MKLLLCPTCTDVRKLQGTPLGPTRCQCGDSWGYYHDDDLHATVGGKAIPLGIANGSLIDALKHRPNDGWGSRFEAFVIPYKCPTVKEEKDDKGE